jgi:hypothetical protein
VACGARFSLLPPPPPPPPPSPPSRALPCQCWIGDTTANTGGGAATGGGDDIDVDAGVGGDDGVSEAGGAAAWAPSESGAPAVDDVDEDDVGSRAGLGGDSPSGARAAARSMGCAMSSFFGDPRPPPSSSFHLRHNLPTQPTARRKCGWLLPTHPSPSADERPAWVHTQIPCPVPLTSSLLQIPFPFAFVLLRGASFPGHQHRVAVAVRLCGHRGGGPRAAPGTTHPPRRWAADWQRGAQGACARLAPCMWGGGVGSTRAGQGRLPWRWTCALCVVGPGPCLWAPRAPARPCPALPCATFDCDFLVVC